MCHPTATSRAKVREEPPAKLKDHPDLIRATYSLRSAKEIKGRVPIMDTETDDERRRENKDSSSSSSDSDSDSSSNSDSISGPTGKC